MLSLDAVPPVVPDGEPRAALFDAIEAMDGPRAEGIAVHLLAEGQHEAVLAAVHRVGTTWLGHVGHGLIMATQVNDLCTAYDGGQHDLLRAPVRYLASFRVPDGSAERAAEALGSASRGDIAGRIAEELHGGASGERLCALITEEAAAILVRYELSADDSLVMPVHLLTACHAASRAVAQGFGDRRQLVRVATWLDMAVAGETELGALPLTQTPPQPSRSWDVERLAAAVVSNDPAAATRAVPGSPSLDPAWVAYATELACLLAGPTLLHSLKSLDAAVREHASAATERARFSFLAVFARLAAAESGPRRPTYRDVVRALELDPHPLIGG